MGAVERVRELVQPIVDREQVQLYDIEHDAGVLRIMLDRPDGIDVDTIGILSQLISDALDEDDPIPDSRYLLEVTSPGIERKLRTPEHFRAVIGEDVAFKVKLGTAGARRFNARLDAADADGIEVTLDDADGSTRSLAYDDLESARTIFHWGEQTSEKPGKQSKSAKKGAARSANTSNTETKPSKTNEKKASAT